MVAEGAPQHIREATRSLLGSSLGIVIRVMLGAVNLSAFASAPCEASTSGPEVDKKQKWTKTQNHATLHYTASGLESKSTPTFPLPLQNEATTDPECFQ